MSSLNLTTHPAVQRMDWRLSPLLHLVLVGFVVSCGMGALGGARTQGLSFRAASVYAIVLFVLRLAGKRTLAEVTTFDFVLLLIVSEATQQALLGTDTTISGAAVVIGTLVAVDLALSYAKGWWPLVDVLIEGQAVQLIDDGRTLDEVMARERVDLSDILEAARRAHGLEGLGQIKHAVLERSGTISIVPRS